MELKLRKAATEAYRESLNTKDKERLNLFVGLWELRDEHLSLTASAREATDSYAAPSLDLLEQWYWDNKPIFSESPFLIDESSFIAALEACTKYLTEHAEFLDELAQALDAFSWSELVEHNDLVLAGTNPLAYIEDCCAWIDAQNAKSREDADVVESEKGAGDANHNSAIDGEVAAFILASSLRAMLQDTAASLMKTLAPSLKSANNLHVKPKQCPICGSAPQASAVGETPSGLSNGRLLYCGICGTIWEFERIRCAHCGTHNQAHLHYFHIEGDESHRLYNCQECGNYTRTVFQESLNMPLSLEVEDIIMAKLDAAARDDRFSEQAESRRVDS